MWKWLGILEWPSWLLAAAYLICVLATMLGTYVVHVLLIKPIGDALIPSMSRAARALLAAIAPPRNRRQYITLDPADMTWTGQGLVIGSGGQLGPLTVTATGTVGGASTNPRA